METRMENEWKTARCPICGREYQHKADYKPATCSSWECINMAITLKGYRPKRQPDTGERKSVEK